MYYASDLPIEEIIPDIRRALAHETGAVIEAPPGAGKTTIVPLALLDEPWLAGGRIIMLEPRRLAARASAARMSELRGEETGSTVGYRTRLDTLVGPSTRIEVVTEGVLTRFLQNDPSLKGIGCVIFDEYHERSLQADLGLALTLESRSFLREDLRIVVMSATLDGSEVSALLGGAPVLKSSGRAFPVTVRYMPQSPPPVRGEGLTGPAFISRVTGAVLTAIKEEEGGILVFLPGSGEIKRVEAALSGKDLPPGVQVAALYGDLSKEAQDQAIRPSGPGKRKVVLATSIAETSLTIEGVRVVIDGGLKRVQRFSPSTGMSRLETVRVTKDSAEQRSGRAGRTCPGVSIRLWPGSETASLREKSTPEIMEADLAPLAMELALRGVKDPGELKWLTPPPPGAISHAREVLLRLEAIDAYGGVTAHGRRMARLSLHPRLAHMAIKGMELGHGSLACHLSALLTERDFFRPGPAGGRDSDIRRRLESLLGARRDFSRTDFDRALSDRIKTVAKKFKKEIGVRESGEDVEKAGLLLAFAYPDRIAKRRPGNEGRYLLSNGRGAYFQRPEPLSAEEYIVAASLDGGEKESVIFLAAPVSQAALERHFAPEIQESETVEWDQAIKGVAAARKRSLWGLVFSESRIENPGREEVLESFLSGIRLNGLGALPWDKRSENLMARIRLLDRLSKEKGPVSPAFSRDFSDERLLDGLGEWLGPWLDGMTRLEHLKRLDMNAVITGMLTWEERQALERLVPTHITVPSGSRIPVDYSGPRPVLAVRLQEVFGLDKTPAVAGGKLPLLLHLLSPAGRPVQVTEDLAGFWASGYLSVKKELKGRYPKHHWPDDPLRAEPARGVKRGPRSDK